mmetsp:Transcript_17825/g.31774  ORF Transcript_17825/g.31774 Transcript_17825/m.31774 type:complete len:450 (+) Transcript_17825:124-1473(+)
MYHPLPIRLAILKVGSPFLTRAENFLSFLANAAAVSKTSLDRLYTLPSRAARFLFGELLSQSTRQSFPSPAGPLLPLLFVVVLVSGLLPLPSLVSFHLHISHNPILLDHLMRHVFLIFHFFFFRFSIVFLVTARPLPQSRRELGVLLNRLLPGLRQNQQVRIHRLTVLPQQRHNRRCQAREAAREKAKRVPIGGQPSRAAHAVHVRVDVGGEVVVDDVREAADVEPSARHVGGHQHVGLAATKREHRILAFRLASLPVQHGHTQLGVREEPVHVADGFDSVGEDEDAGRVTGRSRGVDLREMLLQLARLLVLRAHLHHLGYLRTDGPAGMCNLHSIWSRKPLRRGLGNRIWHRGRHQAHLRPPCCPCHHRGSQHQGRLRLLRLLHHAFHRRLDARQPTYPLQLLRKSQRQQLVRLVQHNVLEVVESGVPGVQHVKQAAGRGDEQVRRGG